MEIFASPRFKRAFNQLPQTVREKAKEREKVFKSNPFDPRLETHKLGGRYKDFWAFSIDRKYRIMFQFGSSMKEAIFINAGTYEIYK